MKPIRNLFKGGPVFGRGRDVVPFRKRLAAGAGGLIDLLLGFGILTAFFLLGSLLNRIGIPIPGGVLGLIVFYGAMAVGVVKLAWVETAANLLLRHMVLLFVPVTVGLMEMGRLLAQAAVPLLASLLVSWLAVLFTTGLLGRWLFPAGHSAQFDLPIGKEAGQ